METMRLQPVEEVDSITRRSGEMSDEDRKRGVPQNELHLNRKGEGEQVQGNRKAASEMARGERSRPEGGLVQSGEDERLEGIRDDTGDEYSELDAPGYQQSDQPREQRWKQNADDIGRQWDHAGFAQGGGARPDRQQGWSGELSADRQQFQSHYDEQIQDDGSMNREQKLQQGWQDPEDPSQLSNEGLIDEDEKNLQGGRIRRP
jgi:hypothetical protein